MKRAHLRHNIGKPVLRDGLFTDVHHVAADDDRKGFPCGGRLAGKFDCRRKVVRLDVDPAVLQPLLHDVLPDLDSDRNTAVHGHGPGLGAAHAAQPRGEEDAAAKIAVPPVVCDRRKGLEGPFHHTLASDVFPGAGGVGREGRQVAVHEVIELRPVRLDDIGKRHDDARRQPVCPENRHRHARLDG